MERRSTACPSASGAATAGPRSEGHFRAVAALTRCGDLTASSASTGLRTTLKTWCGTAHDRRGASRGCGRSRSSRLRGGCPSDTISHGRYSFRSCRPWALLVGCVLATGSGWQTLRPCVVPGALRAAATISHCRGRDAGRLIICKRCQSCARPQPCEGGVAVT